MLWPLVTLDSIRSNERYSLVGGPFGSNLTTRDYVDDGVPVIRGANLPEDRKFLDEDFVYVSEEKADQLTANLAFSGDVIFTQRGTLGQVGLIPNDCKHRRYVLSQSQMKLTVDRSMVDPTYVYYFFRQPTTVQYIRNHDSSSGVPHINLAVLKAMRLPLPPLASQQRIVETIEAYDDLIDNNRRRIKLLGTAARQLFDEWFGRLRFPGHEHSPIVDSFPIGWKRSTLGSVAENFDRRRVPLSVFEREAKPGPYPYHGAAGILGYIDEYIFDGRYLLVGEDGTVQTTSGTPMLQLLEGKFWVSNHAHVIQGRVLSTEFLNCFLSAYQIAGHVTGVAQPKLTQANLNRIPILLPPTSLLEQFQQIAEPIIGQTFVLKTYIEKLCAARNLLLPRLMSGELTV